MKSYDDLKLECLRMAAEIHRGRATDALDVIASAVEYLDWLWPTIASDGDDRSKAQSATLLTLVK